MSDPFSLTFSALWDLLEAHPDIDDVIKVGNRIKFDSLTDRDPVKKHVLAGDLPEIVLVSNSLTANMHQTSCSSRVIRRYTWLIATGDFRLNSFLLPIEWLIFIAMHNWHQVLTKLEYPSGYNFVKRVDLVDMTEGLSDAAQNRGINGWSAVWGIEVEMHFDHNNIVAALQGGSSSSS